MRVLLKKGAKMGDRYQTDEEIATVVAGFEQCTTGKTEFTHLSHLTVAAYYLRSSSPDETFQKMRFGLQRFLDHHCVDRAKYSDPVTWAWIEQIQSVIEQMDDDASMAAVTNRVLERLGDYRGAVEDHRRANVTQGQNRER